MTLTADSSGVVQGKFTIPANVRAGTKRVHFEGAGGSFADADFFGQGILETRTLQEQITVTTVLSPVPRDTRVDPLAQTFTLLSPRQIGAVELFVVAKGSTPIQVQIRETLVGIPTQTVIAETQLVPSAITINAWNRFTFPRPFGLQDNTEYAIVVLCNDAVGAVAVAELGKFDSANQKWVTSQPYQVGVLLSSSNASTWTPHQDRDLTFRLLAASYTQTEREIALGNVAVSGATDLLILALTEQPAADANSEIDVTLPSGAIVKASDGQVIRLDAATTGNVGVKARLRANANQSAVLIPGMQVVAGAVSLSADYVSNAFDADAAGSNVRVIIDATLPSGAGVLVYVAGVDVGDPWVAVPSDGTPKPLGDGKFEYQFYKTGVMEARVRVKLELSGTVQARPLVQNLRVSVT